MDAEDQQIYAFEVAEILKTFVDKDVVLAGGAPRDWLVGREANDIDVWLRSYNIEGVKELLCLMLDGPLEFKDIDLEDYQINRDLDIDHIIEFDYKGVQMQLIFSSGKQLDFNVAHIIRSFDISICKAWMDLDTGELKAAPEFFEDMMRKRITFYTNNRPEAEVQYARDNHLQKVMGYFPDFTLKEVKGMHG